MSSLSIYDRDRKDLKPVLIKEFHNKNFGAILKNIVLGYALTYPCHRMLIAGLYDFPLLSFRSHDRNAAVVDGDMIFAYEEAKISTVREDGSSMAAERALFAGLKHLNKDPHSVDLWTFPTPPKDFNSRWALQNFFLNVLKIDLRNDKKFDQWLQEKLLFVPHHVSHVALAAETSPFVKCAVLSMDGGGDHGDHRHIVGGSYDKTKRETPFQEFLSLPGSIGIANLHAWITESIGLSDDGKMAGLAGYGKVDTELYRQLSQLLVWDSANYAFQFTRQRFKPSKYRLDRLNIENYERKKIIQNQPGFTNVFEICRRFAPQDVAATGSKLVQDALIPTLKKLKEISTLDCLTVVGGLFNNVSINRVILESGIFREVHFSMSPGDAGLGLGAAMWARRTKDTSWTEQTPKRRALSPFVGPCFSSDEIAKILKDTRTPHKKLSRDKMAAKAAQVIADGGIVGVFVDRAEYGPRSLGHRSILGDPRKIDTKQKINLYLKKRDWFMPYAPAILEEFASEWIPNSAPSPYMQIAFKVRPNYEKIIPSAIHVDGSARFQIVSAEHSEFFHSIISSFHKLTGVPIVLNTSFNRHGIATISTPRQALQHLLECSCEYLILGDYWLDLNEIRKLSPIHIVIEDESLLLKKFESSYREKLQQIES